MPESKNDKMKFKLTLPMAKSISNHKNNIRKSKLSDELDQSIVSARMYKSSEIYNSEETMIHPTSGLALSKYSNIYLEGICSGIEMDLHEEKMTDGALLSMVKSMESGIVLRQSHDQDYTGTNGKVLKLFLTKDESGISSVGYLSVLNNPDLDPNALKLYHALESGTVLGVSIGGYIKKYHFEFDEELEKDILHIDKVQMEELTTTEFPAYTPSTANLIKTLKNIPMTTATKSSLDVEKDDTPVSQDPQDTEEKKDDAAVPEGDEDAGSDDDDTSEDVKKSEDKDDDKDEKEEENVSKGDVSDSLKERTYTQKYHLFDSIFDITRAAFDVYLDKKSVDDFPEIKSELIELVQMIPDNLDGTIFAKSLEEKDSEFSKLVLESMKSDLSAKDKMDAFSDRVASEISKEEDKKAEKSVDVNAVVAKALEASNASWEKKFEALQKSIESNMDEPAGPTVALKKTDSDEDDDKEDEKEDEEVKKWNGKTFEEWQDVFKGKTENLSNDKLSILHTVNRFFDKEVA